MKAPSYQFIDANLIMYSIGGPHPLRAPCRIVLEKIKDGRIQVVTNTEVLQEILYRFFSIKRFSQAESAYTSMVELCAEIFPVTLRDTDLAMDLIKKYPGITSRDAVHAATMIHHDIKEILSADSHFDSIREIRRVPPA
ncbi:MAG: type II toxin-antitoxin system VapC family toxin [Deltaproteobacteria bacterium]|nr:type II toxin-antitoxin system VapC family toxin [Deltaproteobacteria bacterium]